MMTTCTPPQQAELEQSDRSPLAKSPSAPGSPEKHHHDHDYDDDDDNHDHDDNHDDDDNHDHKDEDKRMRKIENSDDFQHLPPFCPAPWLRAPSSPDSILMQFVKLNTICQIKCNLKNSAILFLNSPGSGWCSPPRQRRPPPGHNFTLTKCKSRKTKRTKVKVYS